MVFTGFIIQKQQKVLTLSRSKFAC